MKLDCFVLHTSPEFDNLVGQIKKHKGLSLMPVVYDVETVSKRTFPITFNPVITFIDQEILRNEFGRIYTLIQKSCLIVAVGQNDSHRKEIEEVCFTIPFVMDTKSFALRIDILRQLYSIRVAGIPSFDQLSTKVSALKKGQQIEVQVNDIVTIRITNGKCYFGLMDRTIIGSNTLAELYSIFRNPDFFQATEDVIVNMYHLDGHTYDILRMANGINIQLGRKFRLNYYHIIEPMFIAPQKRKARLYKVLSSIDESFIAKERKGSLTGHPYFPH